MRIVGDNSVFELIPLLDENDKKNNWENEWFTFKIKIKLEGFLVNINMDLIGSDISQFIFSLSESYESSFSNEKKEAELKTLEDSLYLKGAIDYKGSVQWSGFFIYPIGDGNRLNFHFNTDLNQLLEIKNQLQKECFFLSNSSASKL